MLSHHHWPLKCKWETAEIISNLQNEVCSAAKDREAAEHEYVLELKIHCEPLSQTFLDITFWMEPTMFHSSLFPSEHWWIKRFLEKVIATAIRTRMIAFSPNLAQDTKNLPKCDSLKILRGLCQYLSN